MNASSRKVNVYGKSNEDHLKALELKQKSSKSSALKTIIKNAKKTAKDLENDKQRKIDEELEQKRQVYIKNHKDQDNENLQKHNESNVFQENSIRQSSKEKLSNLFKPQFIINAEKYEQIAPTTQQNEEEEKNNKSNNSFYFQNFSGSPIKKSNSINISLDNNINTLNNLNNDDLKITKKSAFYQGSPIKSIKGSPIKSIKGSPIKRMMTDANHKSLIIQEQLMEHSETSYINTNNLNDNEKLDTPKKSPTKPIFTNMQNNQAKNVIQLNYLY